jgi:hypothetical protein
MVCRLEDGLHLSVDDTELELFASDGQMPIPAHLDTQLDYMTIQCMHQEMEKLKNRFNKILYRKDDNRNWHEIYLTIFLLLLSLETVHRHQTNIVRRFQSQVRRPFS